MGQSEMETFRGNDEIVEDNLMETPVETRDSEPLEEGAMLEPAQDLAPFADPMPEPSKSKPKKSEGKGKAKKSEGKGKAKKSKGKGKAKKSKGKGKAKKSKGKGKGKKSKGKGKAKKSKGKGKKSKGKGEAKKSKNGKGVSDLWKRLNGLTFQFPDLPFEIKNGKIISQTGGETLDVTTSKFDIFPAKEGWMTFSYKKWDFYILLQTNGVKVYGINCKKIFKATASIQGKIEQRKRK